MYKSEWKLYALLLAALCTSIEEVSASSPTNVTPTSTARNSASASSRTSTSQPTCPSQIINYITHTLPQQCLTTSWQSASAQNANHTSTGSPAYAKSKVSSSSTGGTSQDTGDVLPAHAVSSTVASSLLDGNTLSATRVSNPDHTATSPHVMVSSQDTPSTVPSGVQEPEKDSPLDTANFLSFEEWKKQNLAKAGQSAENLGAKSGEAVDQRRRPAPINNAFDSLGEDSEIDFDFGGFAAHGPMQNAPPLRGSQLKDDTQIPDTPAADSIGDGSAPRKRPKDAGRTCKERTNYASYDCAATMLKTNPESKSSSAVLVENKDTYMLNKCSAQNKFFIVELCDNILIDTVVLANFEFFSSMFRTFKVSVSDKYPVKLDKWRELGIYEGRNSREVQAFLVENPLIWARYIRIEFMTHYGKEYYCPVSLLRVHGTTMMEEFNSEIKSANGDDDSEADSEEELSTVDDTPLNNEGALSSSRTGAESIATEIVRPSTTDSVPHLIHSDPPTVIVPDFDLPDHNTSALQPFDSALISGLQTYPVCLLAEAPINIQGPSFNDPSPTSSQRIEHTSTMTGPTIATPEPTTEGRSTISGAGNSTSPVPSQSETSSTSSIRSSDSAARGNGTSSSPNSSIKSSSTPSQPPPANPTTQESFFKSVHKRLQQLEANSTLSLRYIEDQSRILRDAFAAVDKRQSAKSALFFDTLNKTVLTELLEFRKQYDQIWQSTVLELSSQREQSQHEVLALSARLSLLADEIVFQKRMAILQFMLILLCLGLVIFSRNGHSPPYLELRPLMQNAFSKSSVNLSKYAPLFDTPPASPTAGSRPPSRGFFGGFRQRGGSPEQDSFAKSRDLSPSVVYSPPTPESQLSDQSDGEMTMNRRESRPESRSDGPPEAEDSVRANSLPSTPEAMKEERRHFRDGLLDPSDAGDQRER